MLDTECSILDFRGVERGHIHIRPKADIERDASIPTSFRGGSRAPRLPPENMLNKSA